MGPLQNLTVLDLTRALSGPYATLLLAGMGARVIKVEELGFGDVARGNVPYAGRDGVHRQPQHDDDLSVPFLDRNRGKLGVTLNLKHERAREVFADLVRHADLVVENFSPGTADRLGVGYAFAAQINPAVVYASINGFGSDADASDGKAYDLITQALSGVTMASGMPGDEPTRIGIPAGDLIAPLYAVMGSLAAIIRARETGEGQHVDVSMLGALTALVAVEPWDAYEAVGMEPRTGNFLNRLAPFGLFECLDGRVAICAATDKFFARVPAAIGRPELLEDERFARRARRASNAEAIHAILGAWTAERTVEEIVKTLNAADIPVAPVRTPREAIRDPRVLDRHETVPLAHPTHGEVGALIGSGLPIRFSRDEAGFAGPAPIHAQHNSEVYGRLLGYTPDQLEQMASDGLI
ncbi:CoA transferase [Nocardioides sp. BP30]|uniref:CaiB/BaiF CoA transferase family protein n=1 Tax=Nocardioides sp. BP30 TaxID=3036374 RepID=UPI002469B390|nr:CoA transferase [Nocardioides sp. BP30]WGL54135.1 CoA transferase [Nocardioides sp. BP30]